MRLAREPDMKLGALYKCSLKGFHATKGPDCVLCMICMMDMAHALKTPFPVYSYTSLPLTMKTRPNSTLNE